MLVGQLLALSYLSRLYGPPPGATPLGKVSAVYIGLFLGVGVVGTLVLPAAALGLARTPMFEELQLWRLLTAVFWANGLGLDFALQLWFFGSFSSLLERRHFHNTPFKYAATLLCGTLLIALQVPDANPNQPARLGSQFVSAPSRRSCSRASPLSWPLPTSPHPAAATVTYP